MEVDKDSNQKPETSKFVSFRKGRIDISSSKASIMHYEGFPKIDSPMYEMNSPKDQTTIKG